MIYYNGSLPVEETGEDALRHALCALRSFNSAGKCILFVIVDDRERENVPFLICCLLLTAHCLSYK